MIKIKHLLFLLLCCCVGTAFAQKSARISGTVSSDAEGPLIMVTVTERDKSNRIIEYTTTDFEGNFSMVVKNTSNYLEVAYIGYKTQKLEIGDRTVFDIKMVEDNVLDAVEIVAKHTTQLVAAVTDSLTEHGLINESQLFESTFPLHMHNYNARCILEFNECCFVSPMVSLAIHSNKPEVSELAKNISKIHMIRPFNRLFILEKASDPLINSNDMKRNNI